MNRHLTVIFGVLIVGGALLAAAFGSSRGKAASPLFVPCPPHLIAPYGGADGWSTIQVQANFAKAVMAPGKKMTCQYRFGSHPIAFGIQKPCPAGSVCVAKPKGFLITP
ncbi:MAG: hypothetical protein WAM70_16615 [Pyrinomonadaceae bacterium]